MTDWNGGKAGRRSPGIDAGEFAGAGLQFALTIVVFLFIGMWLDRRLGTSPWLLIVGVFVGAAGSFFSLYRRVIAAQRRERDQSGGGSETR